MSLLDWLSSVTNPAPGPDVVEARLQTFIQKVKWGSGRYRIENLTVEFLQCLLPAGHRFRPKPGEWLSTWNRRSDLSAELKAIAQKALLDIRKAAELAEAALQRAAELAEEARQKQEAKKLLDDHAVYVQQFMELTYQKISRTDEYGDERWHLLGNAIDSFVTAKLRYYASSTKPYNLRITWCDHRFVHVALAERYKAHHAERKSQAQKIAAVSGMSGEEFELYVADYLRGVGFENVATTAATGDFGADLVVRHCGKCIVVQCKRHAKPIGLKAVQEVAAARSHYQTGEAWVISSSSFTRQAHELADSTGVRLYDMQDFARGLIKA